MRFKAVLFDIDGTLLDTLEDLGGSMNTVLQSFGFPVHAIPAYKYFVGDGLEMLVRRTLPENRRDRTHINEATGRMRAEYARRWADKTRPYDGIPPLLDRIVARGLKLVVLSNKPDGPARQVIAHFFGRWHFEIVMGARPSVPNKPDPAGARQIAAMLDLPPEDFLYLGDTGVDMQTAVLSGMYAAGVLWGFRQADELMDAGARMLVRRPADLLAWI